MGTYILDAVQQACQGLCADDRERIVHTIRRNVILTREDLRQVSDMQYFLMGISVDIANRLKLYSQIDTTQDAATVPAPPAPSIDHCGSNGGQVSLCTDRLPGDISIASGLAEETADDMRVDLFSYLAECAKYLREEGPALLNKTFDPGPRDFVRIPVGCLRWTHDHIHSRLVFGNGDHEGHSVFQLFDEFVRGERSTEDINEPLDVVVIQAAEGGGIQLYSVSNRRLMALSMFQGVQRDKTVYTLCVLRPADAKFRRSLSTRCNGLSVTPFPGESTHMGLPLFDSGRAVVKGLQQVAARDTLASELLDRVRLRPSKRAPSEHSWTIAGNASDVGDMEEPPAKRQRIGRTPWWINLEEQVPASDDDIDDFVRAWALGRRAKRYLLDADRKFCRLVIRDFDPPGGKLRNAEHFLFSFVKNAEKKLDNIHTRSGHEWRSPQF